MESDLDSCFERVEKTLGSMIDSLAKNNPSQKVAEELLAAETQLSESLKLLETHQNNNARLQQLRQETSLHDTQLKDIMNSLWNMRKELKAVPTTTNTPGGPKHQFTTAELLAYARRISRNTLPLPGVTNGVDMSPSQSAAPPTEAEDSFRLQSQPTQTQTPTASFNLSFNGTVGTPGGISAATPTTANDTQATTQLPPSQPPKTTTQDRLPPHLKPAINPLHGASFHPWPTEGQIRSGALAALQRLVDAGIEPRGYDPAEEAARRAAEEQARRDAEERARLEREAADRRAREERERMARERELARQRNGGGELERRDSVAVGRDKPKQFTFLGSDDDDDEEDD
ncbi:vitamin-D-receptor interacting mediator subunit 4-domain-containing protein [Chaetomium sp. MPI-CAGE-AT-0009]|nr:vitamin-D-receptor interacting mediator subunit 4-domain-containing protein [Chaetomium sp. MPI-CAGE-AT-0009]